MSERTGAGDRRGLFRNFEAVADTTQSFQILRLSGIALNLLPQPSNVNVNGSGCYKWRFLPYCVKQLIASQHPPPMRRQILEESELSDRGKNAAASDLHGHRQEIDLQIAQSQHLAATRVVSQAAEYGSNAGDQFARAEGFGDVVVAAQLKPLPAVGLGSFCRKKA